MQNPTNVEIDFIAIAGTVMYGDPSTRSARTERLSKDVVIDYGVDGQVTGIELLGFDEIAIANAQAFASANDLAFPRNIAGNFPAGMPLTRAIVPA
jgi:uncharacterized protein YuzE